MIINYHILLISKCERFAIKEMEMKKLIALLLLLILLVGCVPTKEADIIASMYIQYDISKKIVGNEMSVSLFTPPGAESHEYQPSSRDIEAIKKSKLFIYTSLEMDSWIKDPSKLGGEDTIVLDLSKEFTDVVHDHSHYHENMQSPIIDDHDHDIHYWTDPLIFIQLIDAIAETIINIDPVNEEFYRDNAEAYKEEIQSIHYELDAYVQGYTGPVNIYFAGHNALSSFSERYHINIISLQDSYQPDADVTSAQIQAMIEQIKSANTHYLFIEELKEPRVANTIKSELAKSNYELKLLELHGYHNVSKSQLENGITYADLFRKNIMNLKEALDNGNI